MKRIGVFICHCGRNIADKVQVERLKEVLDKHPRINVVEDYRYMCSEPGQKLVRDKVVEQGLDSFVIAACSPTLHETTFRRVARDAGLNPYQCEMANVREQCSWVHEDPDAATEKAARIVRATVQKVLLNRSLAPIRTPVTKQALVIGGGISGIQSALDLANAGHKVILVERNPSIGGHMAQLSETFPTLDCSQCILTPKMVEISHHPNVTLMTYSEVEQIEGHVGDFKVRIRQKPRYVEADKCTGCGDCVDVCPSYVPHEFERGLVWRKAIYIPFPQAVPNVYCLDASHCLGLNPLACAKCAEACDAEAINYDMQPEIIDVEVGTIILATGYELYKKEKMAEFGAPDDPDIVDGLQFERLLSPAGPTQGIVRRPSDGKIPKEVVFIQCCGSRDPEQHLPYCSKICCMYTAKHAMLYKHRVHDGTPYIFYMDIRAGGKRYEEFVQRATEEEGVFYLRGRVSRIFRDGDQLVVWGADTLAGTKVEVKADLVVLSMAMVPEAGSGDLARQLRVAMDEHGFVSEAHPKLRPVESLTSGVFLAGCAQAPRDIPETVAQASGAASKAIAVLSSDELEHDPTVVGVEEEHCSGCAICVSVCPYGARELDPVKNIVRVTEVLCEGCGACSAACPSGAAQQRNLTDEQIFAMIEASLEDVNV
jgi:heterodisulfide reductase subunit A